MREKHPHTKRVFAVGLSGLLVWSNLWASWPTNTADAPPLTDLVQKPYLVLLEQAEELKFSEKQLDAFRRDLKKEEKAEKKRLEREEKELKEQVKELRKRLDVLNKSRSRDTSEMTLERSELHCQIVPLEKRRPLRRQSVNTGFPLSMTTSKPKWILLRSGLPKRRRSFWLWNQEMPGSAVLEMWRTSASEY